MFKNTSILTIPLLTFTVLALAGCKQQPRQETSGTNETTAQQQNAALPPDLFVPQPPTGARSVGDLKADLQATGDVVVHGRIGGRAAPFADGAAVFLLADMSMKPCNELHGDSCPTPWDYCCEPSSSLAARTATIQIVDAKGKPLRVGLNGHGNLQPLAEVTIAGDVVPRDSSDTLLINARQVYVHPAGG